jgi:hypothetical protein
MLAGHRKATTGEAGKQRNEFFCPASTLGAVLDGPRPYYLYIGYSVEWDNVTRKIQYLAL